MRHPLLERAGCDDFLTIQLVFHRAVVPLHEDRLSIDTSHRADHGGQRLIEIARTVAPAVSTMERGPAPRVVPVLGDWDDDDTPTHTVGDIAGLLADANRYQSDAVTA